MSPITKKSWVNSNAQMTGCEKKLKNISRPYLNLTRFNNNKNLQFKNRKNN